MASRANGLGALSELATERPPRVMVGNPVIETSAQNVDAAGVPVLGYGESAYR
jgi:hypothetical protein